MNMGQMEANELAGLARDAAIRLIKAVNKCEGSEQKAQYARAAEGMAHAYELAVRVELMKAGV